MSDNAKNEKIQIIVDSVASLSKELKEKMNIVTIPLFVKIGDEPDIIDDGLVDISEMVTNMAKSDKGTVSACPSPETYAKEIKKFDRCIVLTLSQKLSGSYNSARLGADMVLEKHPDKEIRVINSCCGTSDQVLLTMFINDKINAGLDIDDIVKQADEYAESLVTLMVMENLQNMIKNGRVQAPQHAVSSLLSVCSILINDGNGALKELDRDRGINKVYQKVIDYIKNVTADCAPKSKNMAVTFCLAQERAMKLVSDIQDACPAIGDVIMVPAGAVAAVYMDDGGVVVSF